MKLLDREIIDQMRIDLDAREELILAAVYDALAELPPPDLSDQIVVTYWVHARGSTPAQVGKEISYHMTSGVRKVPPGSLLDQCTGRVGDVVEFDDAGRLGLVRVGFPLRMLEHQDGSIYSTDVLHIAAGEGIFGLTEHVDIKLCHVAMSDDVLRRFPGPAHGAPGVRKLTNFGDEIAFGTILKPCTGITAEEEAKIVAQAAANPMFLFVKEDENYLPNVAFAPLAERLKCALEAIRQVADQRGSHDLIYAPHITAPPQALAENVRMCIDAGVNGIMLSDLFVGGGIRMVRDMTKHLDNPPAIYAHNGGISVRTRHIYREVLDLFARLDGGDFRQTGPLMDGLGLIRPFGLEWQECEKVLSLPLAGHPPAMIARAGGLDQGNIIPNLIDVSRRAGTDNYLFLAGSAINGVKNERDESDPALGAEAMRQALRVYNDGVFADTASNHVTELKAYADLHGLDALGDVLSQRYGV